MRAPVATYGGKKSVVALGTLPILGFVAWAIYHLACVANAFSNHGNVLVTAWAISFLFMWWVPLAWFERPATASRRQQRALDAMVVAVQIPAYNEDRNALVACLESVFGQTRRPDRILLTDDGSEDPLTDVRHWFLDQCQKHGIDGVWNRQHNQGKRHAQMNVLRHDDSDIIVTLDSDSILDARAIEEGLKPFVNHNVTSVAGMVAVLNTKTNWLTMMTAMLYTPFTRSYRSAQSVLKRVMVNSGTLAFYRGEVIRKYAGIYENEMFRGKPMQMNDDSLMTFYGLLHGDAVHQPTSVAYTLVPENFDNYRRQQMRWMRGTFVRTFWWWRYAPVTSPVFWMPIIEVFQLLMSVVVPVALFFQPEVRGHLGDLALSLTAVSVGMTYMVSVRFLLLRRSDESVWFHLLLVAISPLISLWRSLVVAPMYWYAMATFWKVGSWGTRAKVEVGL